MVVARAALSAALSDKQAGEVKALEWKETSDDSGRYATVNTRIGSYDAFELSLNVRGGSRTMFDWTGHWMNGDQKADSFEAAKSAAQDDYEQRIRSALVDVPAVEPVAWMIDLGDGETNITDNDIIRDRWHQNGRRVNNLYPSSPLSRGAEVIPADPTNEMIDAALSADWVCDGDERAAAINVWHAMYSAALAATRSGSATSTNGKGGAE